MKQQIRKDWVDIAKAIAIIAIVIWHMQFNYYESQWLPLKNLMAGIWPVPVFFMIAGFFLTNEKLIDTKSFILKKIKNLYLPTLYLYLIATLLHNIFIKINFYNTAMDYGGSFIKFYSNTDIIKNCIADIFLAGRELILAPMWFVCVLFVALCVMSIETTIIKRYSKSDKQFKIIQFIVIFIPAIVYSVISFTYQIIIPRYQQLFSAIWLIYIGMWINQYRKINHTNKYMFFTSIFIVYTISILPYTISQNLLSLTICTTAACYALCYLSILINQHCKYLNRVLAFIGRDSFYIMAFHCFAFKVITLILNLFGYNQDLAILIAPTNDNICIYILYAAGGTIIPLFIIHLFRIIKRSI